MTLKEHDLLALEEEVEIEDFYPFMRPAHQGGQWLIAKYMRVISPVERRECNA